MMEFSNHSILAARWAAKVYFDCDYSFLATDTQLSIGIVQDVLIVAYRGSNSFVDWLHNFAAHPAPLTPYAEEGTKEQIKVHSGMMRCYLSSRDLALEYVKASKCQTVIFTGHSLGGNLAALCALDCQYNLGIEPIVYLFGSPDFGNRAFVRSYNARVPKTKKIDNPFDPVPLLPMHLLGYAPIGERVKVSSPWLFWAPEQMFRWTIDPHHAEAYLARH